MKGVIKNNQFHELVELEQGVDACKDCSIGKLDWCCMSLCDNISDRDTNHHFVNRGNFVGMLVFNPKDCVTHSNKPNENQS